MKKTLHALFYLTTLMFLSNAWAGGVERGVFTTAVVDREPVDQVVEVGPEQNRITYFTELRDLTGHNITHQWIYDDNIMFEKTFSVGGPRWRVWSSKNLLPEWKGTWVVKTLDDDRSLLMTQSFVRN
jgi:hypothetical protein